MDPNEEWEQWRAWLGEEPKGRTIYAYMVEMWAWRQIWDGFARVYDEAPTGARKNATFVLWLRWAFPY